MGVGAHSQGRKNGCNCVTENTDHCGGGGGGGGVATMHTHTC